MFFWHKKERVITMCKKLEEIHNKNPLDFLKGIDSLPIDIHKILNLWSIDYAAVSFEDLQNSLPYKNSTITGLAYSEKDDLIILYSKGRSDAETRFTIAHELAHCCLHMDVNSSCHIEFQTAKDVLNISKDKFKMLNEPKEEQADRFARDLLIPTNILLLLLKQKKYSLKQLAGYFLVPVEQMQRKLEDLYKNNQTVII